MDINNGYFLFTDISGYTEFLTKSELDHAQDILNSLLDSTLRRLRPPLIISSFRGDAILTYAPEDSFLNAQTLLELVEDIYFDYRGNLMQMQINTTCTCKACINIPRLDLKVFLHHGSYLLQTVGDHEELSGPDVIVAHRIMKNTVKEKTGLDGYALLTREAVDAMDAAELVADMLPHTDTYEHIGDVPMFIHDLESAWQAEREKQRIRIDADSAWISSKMEVPVPLEVAWDIMNNLDSKVRYLQMESIDRVDENGGRFGEETTFHCRHAVADFQYTILDWKPFQYFTAVEAGFGLRYRKTYSVEPTATGTRFSMIFEVPTEGDAEAVKKDYQDLIDLCTVTFGQLVDEAIQAGRVTPTAEVA